MKNLILTVQIITLLSIMANADAAELHVSIDHINNENGQILAQLFSAKENYNKGTAHGNVMIPAKTGEAKLIFKDLEPGQYVVRIFHDENNNQKMDTNAFGLPTEGYAFSNEAMGNMGPPKYDDMIVVISKGDSQVTTKAKMIYL